jgi:hypothetical protein
MSDAKVVFYRLGYDSAAPGEEQCFGFACPKRAGRQCSALVIAGRTTLKRDPKRQNGGIGQWDWDGDRERPTFTPSINCETCWHGYIEKGRCVNTAKQDEPEPTSK